MKTTRFQKWLLIETVAKPKIYAHIYGSADLRKPPYWFDIVLSAGIATLGLVLNSPAVIIGAMLISPLMGPIMATGLGLAVGDLYLAGKALVKLAVSIAVALAVSSFLVWALPFHSTTSEILSRTNPTLLDLGIAVLSGLAGSIAVGRSIGSAADVTTVPGVAIAVALMPPLCTVGFGLGSSVQMEIMRGAGLLFLTNIVAIVFSAFLVFLMIGLNAAEVRAEIRRCRAPEPLARRLEQGRFAPAMSTEGHLHWRVLLLVVLMAAIAWPLQVALRQLTSEARTREVVQRVIAGLVPRNNLMSEQTEVGKDSVVVQVIASNAVTAQQVREAEKSISERTQREARVSIQSVAIQSELVKLTERLQARAIAVVPPAPAPPPPSFEEQQSTMVARVAPVLASAWPKDAPLNDFAIQLSSEATIIDATYTASRPLSSNVVDLLTELLRTKLSSPTLVLNAKRLPVPRRRGATQRRRKSL